MPLSSHESMPPPSIEKRFSTSPHLSSTLSGSNVSGSPLPLAPPLPSKSYSMVTRSKNNIFKPKLLDQTITKHPLPDSVEPTYMTQAIK